jgi:Flp pilus assembly pilin Flp
VKSFLLRLCRDKNGLATVEHSFILGMLVVLVMFFWMDLFGRSHHLAYSAIALPAKASIATKDCNPPTKPLNSALRALVRQPVNADIGGKIDRIAALLCKQSELDRKRLALVSEQQGLNAELRAGLAALKESLKDKGNWYKGTNEVGKQFGKHGRTVRRWAEEPPRAVSHKSGKNEQAPGGHSGRIKCFTLGESSLDSVTVDVRENAEARHGRPIRWV